MAVFERATSHKFIQQAYFQAKYRAAHEAKQREKNFRYELYYNRNSQPNPSIASISSKSNTISPPRTELSGSHDTNALTVKQNSYDAALLPYDHTSKRRVAMALVGLCTVYVEGLWPQKHNNVKLPLRNFVCEILRRSRIQYPIFQVALCYLARLQPVIKGYKNSGKPIPEKLSCGRRVLVAALQVASKFLQDRCYSASVWARISGLPLDDLKRNELALMEALDWKLFVSYDDYVRSCNHLRVSVDAAFVERAVSPSTKPTTDSTSLKSTSIPTPDASPELAPGSPEVEIWTEA